MDHTELGGTENVYPAKTHFQDVQEKGKAELGAGWVMQDRQRLVLINKKLEYG